MAPCLSWELLRDTEHVECPLAVTCLTALRTRPATREFRLGPGATTMRGAGARASRGVPPFWETWAKLEAPMSPPGW